MDPNTTPPNKPYIPPGQPAPSPVNNPNRKIVFNAPGKPFPNAPTPPPVTQMPGQPKVSITPVNPGLNPNSSNPAFRSFAHDIKSNVADQGVSMAQIIMEEERRKQATGTTREDIEEADQKSGVLKIVLVIAGIVAIIGGGIALFITFRTAAPVEQITTPEDYSPIRAQKVAALELRDGYKNTLLEAIRGFAATRIPPETFMELKLLEAGATTTGSVGFLRMMEILDTRAPDALLRAATDRYVLGLYNAGDANVPFVMFSVDAFENAYVGMKEWERTMVGDIGGMFIDQDTLSVILASSTPSLFQDKVYYNKDTRVVFGNDGRPLLVWAIVNRTQIVITKNGETLNALMSRMTLENITR